MTKTHLRQADFDRIKQLCNIAELNNRQVADIAQRSQATISRVKDAEDFATYKEHRKAEKERNRANRALLKTNEISQEVHDARLEQLADELATPSTEVLTIERIAVALERLADAWEAQPSRRFRL